MWTSLVKEFEASVSSGSVDSAKEFEQWFLGTAEVRLTQKCLQCFFKKCGYRYRLQKKTHRQVKYVCNKHGCHSKVSLYLEKVTRQWSIKQFILEHNHEPVSLQGKTFFETLKTSSESDSTDVYMTLLGERTFSSDEEFREALGTFEKVWRLCASVINDAHYCLFRCAKCRLSNNMIHTKWGNSHFEWSKSSRLLLVSSFLIMITRDESTCYAFFTTQG